MTWTRVRLTRVDFDAFLGAAHAMTAHAYVDVRRAGGAAIARMTPKRKGAAKKLEEKFLCEYNDQRLRWALARSGRGLRAEVVRRALALPRDEKSHSHANPGSLSVAGAAEIAALLAEQSSEQGNIDPLGIARPWGRGKATS